MLNSFSPLQEHISEKASIVRNSDNSAFAPKVSPPKTTEIYEFKVF